MMSAQNIKVTPFEYWIAKSRSKIRPRPRDLCRENFVQSKRCNQENHVLTILLDQAESPNEEAHHAACLQEG